MRREANIPTQEGLEYLKENPSAYVRDASIGSTLGVGS